MGGFGSLTPRLAQGGPDGVTRKTRLDPEALLTRLQRAEAQSESEEDLRVRIEHTLRDAIPDLPEPRYEKSVKTATYLGRADAVHARLVIEYEKPRRMKGALADHAVQQLCDYLTGLAIDRQVDPSNHFTRTEEERLAASAGVATDGRAWVFVQRQRRAWHREVRALNLATAEKLLLWFRATARKDLSSANLIGDFGPATDLASEVVKTFAQLVASGDHPKATVVYDEWQRIFGIVYGTEQLARSGKAPEARSLKTAYHLALKPEHPQCDRAGLLRLVHVRVDEGPRQHALAYRRGPLSLRHRHIRAEARSRARPTQRPVPRPDSRSRPPCSRRVLHAGLACRTHHRAGGLRWGPTPELPRSFLRVGHVSRDSVLLPGQVEAQPDMFAKDTVSFPMTVATLEVPRQVVDRRLVPELMYLLHEAVVEHHTAAAFVRRAEKETRP